MPACAPLLPTSNDVVVATMEEEAAGVSNDDGHNDDDDEDNDAAIAVDVEDNERRHRQPIYTIINLSNRRWQRCQGGKVSEGEMTRRRTMKDGC
jgi:hypothetical protein